ncbi:hypothetical protein D3C83_38190 [compost metagenome]
MPQKSLDESTTFEKSLCQICLPVAASHAVAMPVTPSVKSRPPLTSGVAFGPLAIELAYWFFVNAASYDCSQTGFPVAASRAMTTSLGSRRLCTKTLPPETTGEA